MWTAFVLIKHVLMYDRISTAIYYLDFSEFFKINLFFFNLNFSINQSISLNNKNRTPMHTYYNPLLFITLHEYIIYYLDSSELFKISVFFFNLNVLINQSIKNRTPMHNALYITLIPVSCSRSMFSSLI